MVSFVCESCQETLKKPKLDQHKQRCRWAVYTCLDCNVTFEGVDYRQHTACISEAQKYEKSLYKGNQKNQGQQQNNKRKNDEQKMEETKKVKVVTEEKKEDKKAKKTVEKIKSIMTSDAMSLKNVLESLDEKYKTRFLEMMLVEKKQGQLTFSLRQ